MTTTPAGRTHALTVDRTRRNQRGTTEIYVRARHNGRWIMVDVAELDDASRARWVQANPEARHVVALLDRHA